MFNKLAGWASSAWGAGKGMAGKGMSLGSGMASKGAGWYGGLGSVGQHAIMGAGIGGLTGAFGLNPFNAVPFLGDIDAGGGIGGALAGAAAGAAFGKFGVGLGARGGRVAQKAALRANVIGDSSRLAMYTRAMQFSNKHGDKVLAGLAAGSAGLIGGSMLSTNRPY